MYEYLLELIRRLKAAPHRRRGELVAEAAAFLGLSPATVYRRLAEAGYVSGRKMRADCGTTCVDRSLALDAAGLLRTARRANGRKTLSLKKVTKILEANGMGPLKDEETGEVAMPSPSTVSRALRLHGCHPDQLAEAGPHVRMRSLHPNHVWEMDASVCILFYLPKGEMAVMDERSYNEKKPHNLARLNNDRVIRWLVVDHCSAAFYARYTLGTENALTAVDTLIKAMCRRDPSSARDGGPACPGAIGSVRTGRADRPSSACSDPFCGAPAILYTDPGPAFTAALTRDFLARIGVRHLTHTPGAARATGGVEAHQRIVERGFEGRLRFHQAKNLDDLNARLDDWRISYNAESLHSRHGKTRNGLWLTITEEQLRVPHSEISLRELVASQPKKARVSGALTISFTPKGFEPREYSLRAIPGVMPGSQVEVSVNPFAAPAVDVTVNLPGKALCVYTLQPLGKNEYGFNPASPVIGEEFKSHKDTAADTALKEIEKRAYGAATLEEASAAKKRKERPFAHINIMADVEQARPHAYLPKRGRELVTEGVTREIPPLTPFEAFLRLKPVLAEQGVEWKPEYLASLKERYPDGVPVDALDLIAKGFAADAAEAEREERRGGLRLVSGGM
jgi:transposase InsO family protein